MNKVDKFIKNHLMAFPSMWQNRFDVMSEIMFNSCYSWDENGCVVNSYGPEYNPTKESMLKQFQDKLEKQQTESKKDENKEYLNDLHSMWVTSAEQELNEAQFVADNIDVFAKTYAGVSHKEIHYWLLRTQHQGIDQKYGVINNKPDVIDEEWREAIYKWLKEMIPCVNSLFGMLNKNDTAWIPRKEYKDIFIWAYTTYAKYESKQELENRTTFYKMIAEILKSVEE